MAKSKAPDILLEEPDDKDEPVDYEMAEEGEEQVEAAAETPTVTRAELDELKQRADNSSQLAQAIQQMAGKQQAAPAVPDRQPGESQEDFRKRINDSIFASADPYALIAEIAKRELAPIIGQASHGAATIAKKVIELDPDKAPTFKKYKKEIEEFVGALPAAQQALPQVWEYAHTQVTLKHQDEIQSERAEKIAEQIVERKLREYGIDPAKVSGRPQVSYAEGSASQPGQGTRRRVVRYTQRDLDAADRKGLSIEDYMMSKRGR
jgi:FtsZ-binding cell division protein ZapB